MSAIPSETLWALQQASSAYHLWERTREQVKEDGPEVLREVKSATGWSQLRIAELVGCSKYHLSRVFLGKEPVSVSMLARLYDVVQAEQIKRERADTTEAGSGAGSPGDRSSLQGQAQGSDL